MPAPEPAAPAGWAARLLATLSAGYAALLVWSTHHPKPQELIGRPLPHDKLLHIAAYAILGGLVAATLRAAGRLSWRRCLAAAAALAAFAVVDEATQPLPWFRRTADPIDWIFDVAGIVVGMALVAALVAAWRWVGGSAVGPRQ